MQDPKTSMVVMEEGGEEYERNRTKNYAYVARSSDEERGLEGESHGPL